MGKLILTILFCIYGNLLFGQYFKGDLVYNFQTNDTLRDYVLSDLGIFINTDFQNRKRFISIEKNKLISLTKTHSGDLKSVELQIEDSPVIYTSNKFVDYNTIYPFGIHYKLVEIKDEYKQILNTECRKHIYEWNDTKIIAWIPKNEKYTDTYNLGSLYRKYFFNEGLAYEISQIYNDITHTLTLVKK